MVQITSAESSRRLTLAELRTLSLASLGGALEFYDFVIFVFFTGVIGKLFFSAGLPDWVRQFQTFGIFAAGYLARPLGGIVMAHFGDTRGRKRMFTLSVLLMAIPTLLIGFLPTYQSIGAAAPVLLLVMRVMQGIAIGGEAPGGWVFVAEHAWRGRVGFAVGLLTSGLSCGILLGSLVATAVNMAFSQTQIAGGLWRLPFVIGGVFGFVAMLLRRWLEETPVFEKMRSCAAVSRELPLRAVLREHGRAIAVSVLATWMLTAAIVVVILMTPALLQQMSRLTAGTVQSGNLAGTAALCLSTLALGAATDRFGIRRVAIPLVMFLILATYGLYIGATRLPSALTPLYVLAGIGAGAAVLAPVVMVRAFPAAVRFTGVSFSYNLSYAVFGGVTPLLVSWISHLNQLAPAHYIAAVTILGLVAILIAPTARAIDED
ncbi:MAG TPA: MFS transporter [Candidatus Acidoferrales bacterium]|jgi:MFS family permease|nr:MFS transporter [Candidatus Acidoferrales bacterium]